MESNNFVGIAYAAVTRYNDDSSLRNQDNISPRLASVPISDPSNKYADSITKDGSRSRNSQRMLLRGGLGEDYDDSTFGSENIIVFLFVLIVLVVWLCLFPKLMKKYSFRCANAIDRVRLLPIFKRKNGKDNDDNSSTYGSIETLPPNVTSSSNGSSSSKRGKNTSVEQGPIEMLVTEWTEEDIIYKYLPALRAAVEEIESYILFDASVIETTTSKSHDEPFVSSKDPFVTKSHPDVVHPSQKKSLVKYLEQSIQVLQRRAQSFVKVVVEDTLQQAVHAILQKWEEDNVHASTFVTTAVEALSEQTTNRILQELGYADCLTTRRLLSVKTNNLEQTENRSTKKERTLGGLEYRRRPCNLIFEVHNIQEDQSKIVQNILVQTTNQILHDFGQRSKEATIKEHMMSQVYHAFHFVYKSDSIDRYQLRTLLGLLGPYLEDDFESALADMRRHRHPEEFRFEEFSEWYRKSRLYKEVKTDIEQCMADTKRDIISAWNREYSRDVGVCNSMKFMDYIKQIDMHGLLHSDIFIERGIRETENHILSASHNKQKKFIENCRSEHLLNRIKQSDRYEYLHSTIERRTRALLQESLTTIEEGSEISMLEEQSWHHSSMKTMSRERKPNYNAAHPYVGGLASTLASMHSYDQRVLGWTFLEAAYPVITTVDKLDLSLTYCRQIEHIRDCTSIKDLKRVSRINKYSNLHSAIDKRIRELGNNSERLAWQYECLDILQPDKQVEYIENCTSIEDLRIFRSSFKHSHLRSSIMDRIEQLKASRDFEKDSSSCKPIDSIKPPEIGEQVNCARIQFFDAWRENAARRLELGPRMSFIHMKKLRYTHDDAIEQKDKMRQKLQMAWPSYQFWDVVPATYSFFSPQELYYFQQRYTNTVKRRKVERREAMKHGMRLKPGDSKY